jgi:UDP-N-acetylmuramoylalanine-D-glutamate ligase
LKRRGKAVIAIGEAKPLVRKALEGAIPVYEVDAFSDAVARAYALAQPSGVVLLRWHAPASTCFGITRIAGGSSRTR